MHCTMSYPTKPEDANLLALNEFKKFKNILGLSDHSLGYEIAAASVLLGVRVIEKHFTYNKKIKKNLQNHPISINSSELKKLRENVDLLLKASGSEKKKVLNCEKELRKISRRSLVTTKFIKKGETIVENSLTPKRPGTGIAPNLISLIVGKKAKKNILKDVVLKKNDFF